MIKLLNYELTARGIDFQYPQFTIMMVLSKREGVTQTELTEIVVKDKASVSRNISYLEAKGYVARNKDGGKRNRLFLSDKGKSIIPLLYEIAANNKNVTMTGFTDSEKENIMAHLEKMFLNVSAAIES